MAAISPTYAQPLQVETDFSAVDAPGEYVLSATLGGESATSDPIVVAADVLFARTAALIEGVGTIAGRLLEEFPS